MNKLCILITCIVLVGCSNGYCPKAQSEKAIQEMGAIVLEFDAYSNSLPIDTKNMQITRSDMAGLNVPGCLEKAKSLTISAMDNMTQGSNYYLSNNDDWIFYIDDGLALIKEAELEIARIYSCMPNCNPD